MGREGGVVQGDLGVGSESDQNALHEILRELRKIEKTKRKIKK